jgi:hypothetical protein
MEHSFLVCVLNECYVSKHHHHHQLGTVPSSSSTSKRPYWQEAIQRQREFSEELLSTIQPCLYGPPILPFLSSSNR